MKYKLIITCEIETDDSIDVLWDSAENLLEHGGVRDCFSAANLDASHFEVESAYTIYE
jgi:hypothetical protein